MQEFHSINFSILLHRNGLRLQDAPKSFRDTGLGKPNLSGYLALG